MAEPIIRARGPETVPNWAPKRVAAALVLAAFGMAGCSVATSPPPTELQRLKKAYDACMEHNHSELTCSAEQDAFGRRKRVVLEKITLPRCKAEVEAVALLNDRAYSAMVSNLSEKRAKARTAHEDCLVRVLVERKVPGLEGTPESRAAAVAAYLDSGQAERDFGLSPPAAGR